MLLSIVSKNFEGSNPEISGVLALQIDKTYKKVKYYTFCDRLHMYVIKTLVSGEDVVYVTKYTNINPVDIYTSENQSEDITYNEKRWGIMNDIKKEEIKSFVTDMKTLKSN